MANLLFPHFLNLHRTLACAKSKELSVQIYMDFAAAACAWGKSCDLGACIAADNIMTTINDTHCDHHLLHTIQEPGRLNVFFAVGSRYRCFCQELVELRTNPTNDNNYEISMHFETMQLSLFFYCVRYLKIYIFYM